MERSVATESSAAIESSAGVERSAERSAATLSPITTHDSLAQLLEAANAALVALTTPPSTPPEEKVTEFLPLSQRIAILPTAKPLATVADAKGGPGHKPRVKKVLLGGRVGGGGSTLSVARQGGDGGLQSPQTLTTRTKGTVLELKKGWK